MKVRVIVLSSGGIDSSVMMKLLLKKNALVFPLFINYGQLAVDAEWEACVKICDYLGLKPDRMDVDGFGRLIPSGLTDSNLDIQKDAFLPGRNLLLLTLGAAYGYIKSAHTIAIGLLSNPIFPDQTKDFVSETQRTISDALGIHVSILAPFMKLDKYDMLLLAHKYELPVGFTYSCHSGNRNPCGHCISCIEKIAAESLLSKERQSRPET